MAVRLCGAGAGVGAVVRVRAWVRVWMCRFPSLERSRCRVWWRLPALACVCGAIG